MARSWFLISSIVLGTALAGCSSSDSGEPVAGASDGGVAHDASPDGPGGGPLVAPAGGLALRVNQASTIKTRNAAGAAWGTTIVFMNVTIANGAGAPDVPANVTFFEVQTSTGLVKAGSPDAEFVVGNSGRNASAMFLDASDCNGSLSIAGGASITCNVTASFDGDVAATQVKYLTPGALALANGVASPGADTRTTSAPLAAIACTACGDLCTDVALDPDNCGTCGMSLVDNGQEGTIRCAQGHAACEHAPYAVCPYSDAGSICRDLGSDPYACGACGVSVPNGGACDGGHVQCTNGTTMCGADCRDLVNDDQNCGSCGHVCGTGTFCNASACVATN